MNSGIQLFQTPLTDCPYLDGRQSSNIIVDPTYAIDPAAYDFLLENGFRRSAGMVYRPACPACKACKSTRVPVMNFTPNRSQKRAWRRVEKDLSVQPLKPEFNQVHFELYKNYTRSRHAGSEMTESNISQYMHFLASDWSDTIFLEIKHDQRLLAVAVTDKQPQSISALYTFFDPEKSHLSPGVIGILAQIELARKLELDWLYLGYWIQDCQKMSYKTQYRPIQIYDSGQWLLLER